MRVQGRRDTELWDRSFQILLTFAVFINILINFSTVPTWIFTVSIVALVWKLSELFYGVSTPTKIVTHIVAMFAALYHLSTQSSFIGYEAAAPILVLLVAIKCLDLRNYKDAVFCIVCLFFLLMAFILSNQTIWASVVLLADLFLITLLMFQLHLQKTEGINRRYIFRTLIRDLFLTLPSIVTLFFIFPRFTLATSQRSKSISSVGFSGELKPGQMSNYISASDIAFRVRFNSSQKIKEDQMYFRGAVLNQANGLEWKQEPGLRPPHLSENKGNNTIQYTIFATNQVSQYLFFIAPLTSLEVISSDHRLPVQWFDGGVPRLASSPPYYFELSGVSQVEPTEEMLTEANKIRSLEVPQAIASSLEEITQEIKDELRLNDGLTPRHPKYAARAVALIDDYFLKNGFRYSLNTGNGTLTDLRSFLLKNRVGFCEHYAASAATLLRLLGVPARVVVGFLGGHYNKLNDSYLVRSRDAHAWLEFWSGNPTIKDVGKWITYDPTTSIVPLRGQLGGDFYDLPQELQESANLSHEELSQRSNDFFGQTQEKLSMMWDFIQFSWEDFIAHYDFNKQKAILDFIFNQSWSSLFAELFLGVLLIFLTSKIIAAALHRATTEIFREELEWKLLITSLQKQGVAIERTSGPLHLLEELQRFSLKLHPKEQQLMQNLVSKISDELVRKYNDQATTSLELLLKSLRSIIAKHRLN